MKRVASTPVNSPHPDPLPVRRGEGEATAPFLAFPNSTEVVRRPAADGILPTQVTLVHRGNCAVNKPALGGRLARIPGKALGASVAQGRWQPDAWEALSSVPRVLLECSSCAPRVLLECSSGAPRVLF